MNPVEADRMNHLVPDIRSHGCQRKPKTDVIYNNTITDDANQKKPGCDIIGL